MADLCGTTINIPTGMTGDMDVIDKYKELMEATLDDGSLYVRTKDTFYELFKDLDLDAKEKAAMVAQSMSEIATNLSSASMQTALTWAKEERDGEYTQAILYGQALKSQTDVLVAQATVCKIEAETKNSCAQREVAIAGSIRENGRVLAYHADDTCVPISLQNEGLKWFQTEMVIGQRYSILSDSLLKNGMVTIDSTGTPITTDGTGKVSEDIKFSERQRISFEDSKRNHAANAASQMISGLLASETYAAEHQYLVDKWVLSLDYLNSNSCNPGEPIDCPPVA